MRESQIEARMGQLVKKRGGLYYKFVSPGNPGVPDRIIITPDGRVVWVELKTEVGRLSNLQKWQIEEMRRRGMDVRKVSGWDEAKACVEDVFKRSVSDG
ncbi:VRR-NUC domain-containing protein [Beduinella massiliensis]|uniref:VRR-NUC domain-containing protein n=1 Tax=Beduinella massiliensis TaxID=1852363 RepID=UPI000C843105